MRILVGGLHLESTTLNPIIAGEDDFISCYDDEMLEKGMSPSFSTTGIIQTLKETGCDIVPTMTARAVPGGLASAAFYQKVRKQFSASIKKGLARGPIDGVCLGLHGSMIVENLGHAEGNLLALIREYLPGVPVTAALDMHGYITPELMQAGDGFVGFKTAPHVDCFETGARAARMLLKSIKTGKKLRSACRRIPLLLTGEKSESAVEPMRSLIDELRKAETLPGVEAASFFIAHAWADTEYTSAYSVVTTLDDEPLANSLALTLAESFWSRRRDFTFRNEYYDPAESMRIAYEAVLQKKQCPVFVSDSGDNPTAGSTGDATELLERIMETLATADTLPTPLLYSGFFDVPAVKACINAGLGAKLDITIGGNWDTIYGKKIPLKVEVKNIVRSYGPFKSDLVLVSHRNMLIVITSKHIGFGDPGVLPALSINPEDYCLVAVKLGYLEPCFQKIAARAIMATTKGCSNELLETFPFKKIIRPMYPLDPDIEFSF